jgi:hypothetical protein
LFPHWLIRHLSIGGYSIVTTKAPSAANDA